MKHLLAPTFFKDFKCIADKCENHCCQEWRIGIDKGTYKKYIQKNLIKNNQGNIIVNKLSKNENQDHFAYIELKEDRNCHFFEDGLCSIQKHHGEGFLSPTCAGYPRKRAEFYEHIELSLSMSCPEAVRLMIKDSEPIAFEFIEPVKIDQITLSSIYDDFKNFNAKDLRRYMWDIRSYSIEIFQNSDFTIGQRLMILGLFVKRVQQQLLETEPNIELVIEGMMTLLSDVEQAKKIFTEDLAIYPVTEDVLKSLREHSLSDNSRVSSHYVSLLNRITHSLELNTSSPDYEKSIAIYNKRYEKLFKPFMEKNSYMIEHVLVSEIYQRLFPIYDNEQDINKSYQNFMMQYYLIQLCLTCSADETAGITDMQFVEDIHSLYRKVEHTKNINDIFNS